MKRIFTIQNGMGSEKEFISQLVNLTSIPMNIIEKNILYGQILISEHYFINIWRNLFIEEYPIYEDFIKDLIDLSEDINIILEEKTNSVIELFVSHYID